MAPAVERAVVGLPRAFQPGAADDLRRDRALLRLAHVQVQQVRAAGALGLRHRCEDLQRVALPMGGAVTVVRPGQFDGPGFTQHRRGRRRGRGGAAAGHHHRYRQEGLQRQAHRSASSHQRYFSAGGTRPEATNVAVRYGPAEGISTVSRPGREKVRAPSKAPGTVLLSFSLWP